MVEECVSRDVVVAFHHSDATGLFRGANGANFGGMETRAYLYATALAAVPGHSVVFITNQECSDLRYSGIRFIHARPPVKRGVPLISRYLNQRRKLAPFRDASPDALITFVSGVDKLQFAIDMGIAGDFPVVATLSCDADIDGSLVPAELRERYFELLQSVSLMLAQTDKQRELLAERHGIDAVLLPSAVEVPPYSAPSGTSILWVGRAAALKRPWQFISLARELPQYKFVMVLLPHDALMWAPLMADAEGVENLTVVPGVSYFEMESYYRDAALVVGTSVVEGFPNVYLQAASFGIPVVSMGIPTSMYGESGGCGINVGGRFGDLVTEVERLMADGEARFELGSSAHSYVKANHSVDQAGLRIAALVSSALSGR